VCDPSPNPQEIIMRAAAITEYGNEPEVIDVEVPEVPADSVMVEVQAAAINPIDWIIMSGAMKEMLPSAMPWIVGYDVAGTVTQVGGDVTQLKVGDDVFGRADGTQAATMAEFAAIKERDLAVQATSMTHQQSAGIPLAGLTAWQALFEHGALESGQRVLIHAGSGGVGTLAIQFAKQAGAWVATTASARNKELVMSLGADQFIDYSTEDFADVVGPCDLIVDMVGGETLTKSFEVVTTGGRVVSVTDRAPDGLAEQHGVTFEQFFMHPDGDALRTIARLLDAGTVRPVVDSVFPLEEVAAAFRHAKEGHATGKVIIAVR
jgi:NADPH:quinone reductase-like Zn-dependent oxidoreductase